MRSNEVEEASASGSAEKIPEISIIVPVYKVEEFLPQCLESIKNQTFRDWECIVVDDGSPDDSPRICDEFAAADPRFKVIHQKNGGLSAARNSGLRAAKGRYIGFVDSDDWVEPTLYQHLHDLVIEHDADMAQVCYYKDFNGFSYPKRRVEKLMVLNRKETARELVRGKTIPSYVWNKLYRREAINTEFPVGKNYEDVYTLNRWMANMRKVVLSPELLCHYRVRKGSIVRSKSAEDRIALYENMIERIIMLEKLEPGYLTMRERHNALWKAYLGKAKYMARISKSPKKERLKALRLIREEAERTAGVPNKKILGSKRYRGTKLLEKRSSLFMSQALLTQRINKLSAKLLPF